MSKAKTRSGRQSHALPALLRSPKDPASKKSLRVNALGVTARPLKEKKMDVTGIAKELIKVDPHLFGTWGELEHKVQSPQFVAMDPVVKSIGLEKDGRFSGLVNVLINTDSLGYGGKLRRTSLTIPALVSGHVTDSSVRVDNLAFRFGGDALVGI